MSSEQAIVKNGSEAVKHSSHRVKPIALDWEDEVMSKWAWGLEAVWGMGGGHGATVVTLRLGKHKRIH